MSLDDLMKPMDTRVIVGVIGGDDAKVAAYVVDFGDQYPPMDEVMARYKKLTLDTIPSESEVTYCVTSDKIVTELTGRHLDLLPEKSLEEVFRDAMRTATPEFASSVSVSLEDHERFQSARRNLDGYWVLVVLASRATEIILNKDDAVFRITPKERSMYVQVG